MTLRTVATHLRRRGVLDTITDLRARTIGVPAARRLTAWLPHSDTEVHELPAAAEPKVSVIIPVFNHWDATRQCLAAIAEQGSEVTTEVLVVDDASTDETPHAAAQIDGLRLVARPVNGGFISACTDGAAHAVGEYLVFLNNDTIPQPGWVGAMLRTFETDPRVGLVGAQLVYRDGTLQESGGIVFDDGQAANYGRGGSPFDPRYAFAREADYCSGAALMVPRVLFEDLGGFDTRYAPAYYEDTDLAFKVREAGRSVVVQPLARVVHDEGVSSGTSTSEGPKAYQVVNRHVFSRTWREALKGQPDPGTPLDEAALHRRDRWVLVVSGTTPHDRAADRVVSLRSGGEHVVLWPLDLEHVGEHTRALQRQGVQVCHRPFSRSLRRFLRAHSRSIGSVAVIGPVDDRVARLLRRYAPGPVRILDPGDGDDLAPTDGPRRA